MKEINSQHLLAQMKVLEAKANGFEQHFNFKSDQAQGFGDMLKGAIDQVNNLQNNAGEMAQRFELGDKSVSLAEVMISLQKSNVSFQALTQVRNRLVSAYQDIMNMPL